MAKAEISLQPYSIREYLKTPEQWKDSMRKVREIGYRSVQIGRVAGLTPQETKDHLDSLGMELSTYCGDLFSIRDDIDGFIKECKLFDVDEIMIGTMPAEFRVDREGYEKAIALMNEVGKQLSQAGIYLAYHNHAQEFRRWGLNGVRGIDLLFDKLNPDYVHFMLDTHWVQSGGGDVIEYIKKCKGRMQYIHVKDYRIAPINYHTWFGATPKEFAEIGEGNLPWPEIIETCKAQGINIFIVEQDNTYLRNSFDAVEISFNTLVKYGLKA